MVLIELTEQIKIGTYWYKTINTRLLCPKTLKYILSRLPENENRSGRMLLVKALKEGDYKKVRGTIYFTPPLIIEGPFPYLITHIVPARKTIDELITYRELFETLAPENTSAIQKLNQSIQVKKEKVSKREELEQSNDTTVPFKKRKYIRDNF